MHNDYPTSHCKLGMEVCKRHYSLLNQKDIHKTDHSIQNHLNKIYNFGYLKDLNNFLEGIQLDSIDNIGIEYHSIYNLLDILAHMCYKYSHTHILSCMLVCIFPDYHPRLYLLNYI